jgi:hypothetical protein
MHSIEICLISSESKDRKMSKTQEKLLKLSQGQGQGHDVPQGDAGLVSWENTNTTYLLHGAGYYLKSWLSLSMSKNILLAYGTQRFITVFTQAHHWTLS